MTLAESWLKWGNKLCKNLGQENAMLGREESFADARGESKPGIFKDQKD